MSFFVSKPISNNLPANTEIIAFAYPFGEKEDCLESKKLLERTKDAKKIGITIVPDCGMGPGMNVTLGLLAMEQLDKPEHLRVWDGGLPLNPNPPWNYSLFFNINGLTNEYDGEAYFLKDSKIDKVPCFEGLEELEFESIGKLEAAVTSGGLSTMPWTYEGKLNTLENKTLRYPGHWDKMIAYRQLGLFSEKNIDFNGLGSSSIHFNDQIFLAN